MADQINTRGKTPEQSGIEAGTITPVTHVQGNGKRRTMYRLQYNTMYFKYSTHAQAVARRDQWIANGSTK